MQFENAGIDNQWTEGNAMAGLMKDWINFSTIIYNKSGQRLKHDYQQEKKIQGCIH